MSPRGTKKPDLMSILSAGGKKGPSMSPPPPPDEENGPPSPDMDPNDPTDALQDDLTPDMLSYHSGGEACGSCSHFQAPSTCDRFPDPVEEAGWCKGWQPMSGKNSEMGGGPPVAAPQLAPGG